jgi:hypothetical protein
VTITEKLRFAAEWLERHDVDQRKVLSVDASAFRDLPYAHLDGDCARKVLAGAGTLSVDEQGFVHAVLDGMAVAAQVQPNIVERRVTL